jgi:methylmalonyl-CoA mutase C-terminal domain/subunit
VWTKIRTLATKPGLDGHRRGALVLVRTFRDAGMEVICGALLFLPEQVAQMATDEDVDVVALSLFNGAHTTAFSRVKRQLEKLGGRGILIIGGGTIIPRENEPKLPRMRITGLYGPGSSLAEIIGRVREGEERAVEGVRGDA